MTRRILLVRHGHCTKADHYHWVHAARLSEREDAYDAAGIRDDSHPPDDLRALASSAALATSDLPRAVASVERLAPNREYAVSSLLREVRIEPPRWIPFRLPVVVWDAMSYAEWRWRLSVGTDHASMRRAREAAAWTERLTEPKAPRSS